MLVRLLSSVTVTGLNRATDTDWVSVPPGPPQVRLKVALVNTVIDSVPHNALSPSQSPLAVHEVALPDVVQDRLAPPPATIEVLSAVNEISTGSGGSMLILARSIFQPPEPFFRPLEPLQTSLNLKESNSGPGVSDPTVSTGDFHP